jgi:hypothetical protein
MLPAGRDHQRHVRVRAGDGPRLADRPAAGDVEALDRHRPDGRAVDRGVQGSPVHREHHAHDVPGVRRRERRHGAAGRGIDHDRLGPGDREQRAVVAEPHHVGPERASEEAWDPAPRRPPAPGGRIDARQRPVVVEDRQHAPVGAEVEARQRGVAADHADRGGALEQRGEEVAAGLHRVVECHALARQQHPAVQARVRERLGAEPLRRGRGRLGARVAALVERHEAGDHGEHEQGADAAEHHPQPALRAPARAAAVVEERALHRAELGVVTGHPVERGREARAAVEPAGVARVGVPCARVGAEAAMQAPALGVLGQPRAQPRPLAQQRLVRDFDGAVGDRQQPAVGQVLDHLGALVPELGQRDPAAHDGAALVLVGEPDQERACGRLKPGIEADEGLLGEPGDGPVDAAAARVGGEAEAAPVALAPELQQRGGQQRQGARLALDVGQQRLDQLALHDQPDPLRRPLDRAAQLLA